MILNERKTTSGNQSGQLDRERNRMSWQGKTVLVTGVGGFIGSHLTERLVELGADVRALAQYNSKGKWGWLDELPHKSVIDVVAGDIRDQGCVLHVFPQHGKKHPQAERALCIGRRRGE